MEKSASEHHTKPHWVLNWKFTFSLAVIAGICAIVAAILILYVSWSAITFNSASFLSEAQRILVAEYGNGTANYTSGVSAAAFIVSLTAAVKNAALLFIPLAAISGAMLLLTAFYFRSRHRKTVLYGTIFAIIFSMAAVVSILAVVPISSDTVATLFGFMGTYSGTDAFLMALAFGLFMAYIVVGILTAIAGVYRLSLMPEHQ